MFSAVNREIFMHFNKFAAATLLAASFGFAAPALAQQADLTTFNTSCLAAQDFLLGELPEGVDGPALTAAVCGCLAEGVKSLSQADIDMLNTDLSGKGTDEIHAAYTDYAALQDKAGTTLVACFETPEVVALLPPPPAQ